MRTNYLVIGFSALAVVIGSAAGGCSSSTKAPAGTISDAAVDAEGDSGATCTTDAGSLSTFVEAPGVSDAGTALWACEKAVCPTEVATCAADSCCNATILAALICSEGASTTAAAYGCFAAAISSTDPATSAAIACLTGAESKCLPTTDGGSDSAAADTGAASDTGTGSETSSTDAATGG